MSTCIATCSCEECLVVAHSTLVEDDTKKIFSIEAFKGKTCFEIMHTDEAKDMWIKVKKREREEMKVNMKHPIIKRLRRMHSLPKNPSRWTSATGTLDDDGSEPGVAE